MKKRNILLGKLDGVKWASLYLFFLVACITPFDPELTDEQPKLTVEGLITDRPGPYRVKLSYSTTYTSGNAKSDFTIYDAQVYIKDDQGNEEQLTYAKAGTYITRADGMRGEVGRSYWVKIVLADGKTYKSVPELLPPVPAIDTMYAEYRDISGEFLQGEFNVFVETKDPKNEGNYYLWRWNNYERINFCEIWLEGTGIRRIRYGAYCCGICFDITNCPGCVNVLSDRYTNGNTITTSLLTFPYDSREPYFLEAEQFAITKEAYEYWQKVAQLTTNSGGVFDKPPITIKGNLFNITDPSERVLGFFGASGATAKAGYFSRKEIEAHPYRRDNLDGITVDSRFGCRSCEESTGLRTSAKPANWDDAPTYYPVVLEPE